VKSFLQLGVTAMGSLFPHCCAKDMFIVTFYLRLLPIVSYTFICEQWFTDLVKQDLKSDRYHLIVDV